MSDALDIAALRAVTPGCGHRVHLNNAGAGLMPLCVTEAVKAHLDLEAEIGGYEAAAARVKECDAVYETIARLVGAEPGEIALVGNATLAWQLAFYSLSFSPGDRILTSRAEYAANYVAYLQMAKRTGCVIDVIPDDADGASDAAALDAMIDDAVKLVAITWIPTNGGLVNPAAAIGQVAQAHGVPYLLDACQAVGQIPVDVMEIGCDFLTATGRKFLRGPRGSGFLYVRREVLERLEPIMIDHFSAPWTAPGAYQLRPDARRFETWEKSFALTLGLGAAADYSAHLGVEKTMARAFSLAEQVREGLAGTAGVSVHDLGSKRCAIVSFSHATIPARGIVGQLKASNINVSASAPSSTLLDATARNLPVIVRVSPHYYNTEAEIDAFLRAVRVLR